MISRLSARRQDVLYYVSKSDPHRRAANKAGFASLSSTHVQQTDRTTARRRQGIHRRHATFFAAKNSVKKDEIAARQLHVLRAYQGPREKPLKLIDVREMFRQMKDQA